MFRNPKGHATTAESLGTGHEIAPSPKLTVAAMTMVAVEDKGIEEAEDATPTMVVAVTAADAEMSRPIGNESLRVMEDRKPRRLTAKPGIGAETPAANAGIPLIPLPSIRKELDAVRLTKPITQMRKQPSAVLGKLLLALKLLAPARNGPKRRLCPRSFLEIKPVQTVSRRKARHTRYALRARMVTKEKAFLALCLCLKTIQCLRPPLTQPLCS